jgi:hypothetical protein
VGAIPTGVLGIVQSGGGDCKIQGVETLPTRVVGLAQPGVGSVQAWADGDVPTGCVVTVHTGV